MIQLASKFSFISNDVPLQRVAKAWVDATEGYRQTTKRYALQPILQTKRLGSEALSSPLSSNLRSVLGSALFHEDFSSRRDNSMVLIQDVEFASTSERTLLPFYGRCHIAYVPRNGVVLGLSKVARLAKMFARRLQNQQRFTQELLEAFHAEVQPLGCAAIVEATHLGRQHESQSSLTAATLGCFYAQPTVFMQEFVSLLGLNSLSINSSAQDSSAEMCLSPSCSCSSEDPFIPETSGQDENVKEEKMTAAMESVLRELGEDPSREGLQGTALRYVQHLIASTSGREAMLAKAMHVPSMEPDSAHTCETDSTTLDFTSQCEHHLLPFQGSMQIVLIPGSNGKKLSRQNAEAVSQIYSSQLQIQERLTHQVATKLYASLEAEGVLVLCKASHMCMVARGVEQHASSTVTVAAYGAFESDALLRRQVVHQLSRHRSERRHPLL